MKKAISIFIALLFVFPVCAENTKVDKILVMKSDRKMFLISGTKTVRQYDIDLGPDAVGHKVQQGDGKTPEGIYKISGRNPGSSYYRSLRVSYPNATDRANAKKLGVNPGGDIMIHGLPNWLPKVKGVGLITKDWTAGCIALKDNNKMAEVWNLVSDGTTIEIKP